MMAEKDYSSSDIMTATADFGSFVFQFDPSKRKKKKKKNHKFQVTSAEESIFDDPAVKQTNHVEPFLLDEEKLYLGDDAYEEEQRPVTLQYPWEENERDYDYLELLSRMFSRLHENNPDLAGNKHRTVMKPPEIQEGTKMAVFANFMDICKIMHRKPEKVMNFFLAEMRASGSLDAQQQLVVNGRFASKSFEEILHSYIKKYVVCDDCKSPDTIIAKENHLFMVGCQQCGSKRTVEGGA